MDADSVAWFNVDDFGGVGKERILKLRGDAQHAVVFLDPNYFSLANQFESLAPHHDLDGKANARATRWRQVCLEIDAGGADIAGQAVNAVDLDRQFGSETVGTSLIFQ